MPIDYKPEAPIQLRPVAQPVDTFTGTPRPTNAGSQLMGIAEGLTSVDKELRGFLDARKAKQDQEDLVRGKADFYANNMQGFEEATREGKIPAFASPTYMASYKRAQGSLAGFDMQAKFNAAYDAWDGKTSEDPTAFTNFTKQFFKENLGKDQDPRVLQGLIPHVNSIMANGLERNMADRHKATVQGAINTGSAEITAGLEAANDAGIKSGKGTPYAETFAAITQKRDALLKSGMPALEADKVVVDAVTKAAVNLRDPRMLGFLDQVVPGQTYTYASTPDGRDAKAKAVEHIERLARTADADRRQADADRDKKTKDANTVVALEKLSRKVPLTEEELVAGSRTNPDFRLDVVKWQKGLAEGIETDPAQMLQLQTDIMNGGGVAAITDALNRGVIKNPADLTKAYSFHKSVTEAGEGVNGILKNEATGLISKAIAARTANSANLALITSGVIGMTDDGIRADFAFRQMLVDFVKANPNATVEQQRAFVGKAGKMVLDSLSSADVGTEAKFSPKEGVPDPYGGASAKPAAGQQSSGQPKATAAIPPAAEAPAAPQPASREAVNWYDQTLTLDQKLAIEADAKAKGQDIGQRKETLYKARREQRTEQLQQQAVAAAQPLTPAAQGVLDAIMPTALANKDKARQLAESDILAAIHKASGPLPFTVRARMLPSIISGELRREPQAAALLNFVAGPESGGHYNAVLGNAASTRDLSQLTLSEVFQLQKGMVARGMASGAVGRYQFINKTLEGLASEMGLNPATTKFTPELQDRMGFQLLKRRGYDEWKAGRMTDQQFAKNLSQEWAAMPNPETGGSFYPGQRAGVGLGQVYSLLRGFGSKLTGGSN